MPCLRNTLSSSLTWLLVLGASLWLTPCAQAEEQAAAELESLLQSAPESAPELLRWMMQNNASFQVDLAADVTAPATYSHPTLEMLRRRARSIDWKPACGELSAEERFHFFQMQRSRHSTETTRLRPVDFVPSSVLFSDEVLRHVIQYLVDHPHGARYEGISGLILYSDPLLESSTEYIWRFASENPAGFKRTINGLRTQPIYERLMINTFNEDPNSQLEPYDHLCARLQTELNFDVRRVNRTPFINRAGMKRFYRQYTDIVFGYPTVRDPAPPVAFGHNGDARTRTFDFICAGELESIEFGEPLPTGKGIRWTRGDSNALHTGNRFIERVLCIPVPGFQISYGVLDLRPDLDKADVQLFLRCPTGVYAMNFEVEKGEGSLPAASDLLRLDQAKAAGELNIVSSFALFQDVSQDRFSEGMSELGRMGFRPVSEPTVVEDLWADFLEEASRPTTSLVVPIYHVLDQERIRLGWNPSRKIVFAKKVRERGNPIRRIRLVVYAPSPDQSREEVLLHRTEFGRLFDTRVASPVKGDTLCLMNMSCFSQYSVESWMAAFREAARSRNLADVDPREIPFIVGAKEGFDAHEPFDLLGLLDAMIRSMCADQTRPEILAALAASGLERYEPMTNMDRPGLLQMGGSFRLHVSREGRPEEAVSF